MTPAARLVARRALLDRPWRSALLLLGYGTGVAIMIVLLSVGDALLDEARDRNLVAGGDVVVLPEGVDPAVIKVNGVTGLFLTIPQARFILRDVVDGPRFHDAVTAAAPQLSDRLLYLRVRGRIVAATASAGIPSLDRAAHAARAVTGGDSDADRAWLDPALPALADRLDHFHTPPRDVARQADSARAIEHAGWAEWDYFNIIDPERRAYAYLTVLAGAEGQGVIIVRLRRPSRPVEDIALSARIAPHDLSTTSADQRVGPAIVTAAADGYHITVDDPRVHVDLRMRPDRGFVLPPAELRQDGQISGYVVPAVRGRADGTIRTPAGAVRFSNAPAYHDHNWGTWLGTTWEWGEAAGTSGAYVYGLVHVPAGRTMAGMRSPGTLSVWAAPREGSGGLLAVLPITGITYSGWRAGPMVGGRRVRAPAEIAVRAENGPDSADLTITVWDALGSRLLEGGANPAIAARPRAALSTRPASAGTPVFLQLRGDARLRGTIAGRPVTWQGPAASETFVAPW